MATKTSVLDEDAIERLRRLVDYNWQDELRDFEQDEGRKTVVALRACHIFVSIVALDNLINDTSYAPESFTDGFIAGSADRSSMN